MNFWKEHMGLRALFITVFFFLGLALVIFGWTLKGQLAGLEAKLQNPGFLAKAPEQVVAAEKERCETLKALIAKLEESAASMG